MPEKEIEMVRDRMRGLFGRVGKLGSVWDVRINSRKGGGGKSFPRSQLWKLLGKFTKADIWASEVQGAPLPHSKLKHVWFGLISGLSLSYLG